MGQMSRLGQLRALLLVLLLPPCAVGCDKADAEPAGASERELARVKVDVAAAFTPRSRSRHLLLLQPNRRATLSPRVGGQVKALLVQEQATVIEGERLLELADTELRGAYTSASAGVSSARAQLADTKKELADAKRLQAQGAETTRRVEQLETQVQTLQAGVRQAQGGLTQARDRKEGSALVAPFAGVITQRHVELGEYLAPGAPAFVLAELDPLKMEVPLSEREVARHYAGATAQGGGALSFVARVRGEALEASLIWVAREADPGTATFAARLRVPNADGRLRAGESVEVEVLGPEAEPVVTIDAQALRWEGESPYALLVSEGKLVRRELSLGRDLGERVVVSEGVIVGERFVTRGLATLVDGDAVVVVGDAAATPDAVEAAAPAKASAGE